VLEEGHPPVQDTERPRVGVRVAGDPGGQPADLAVPPCYPGPGDDPRGDLTDSVGVDVPGQHRGTVHGAVPAGHRDAHELAPPAAAARVRPQQHQVIGGGREDRPGLGQQDRRPQVIAVTEGARLVSDLGGDPAAPAEAVAGRVGVVQRRSHRHVLAGVEVEQLDGRPGVGRRQGGPRRTHARNNSPAEGG
jgi:hypothetical protein